MAISFSQEAEPITVRTMGGPAADPDWKFTDAAGHEHRAYPEPEDKPTWPTLKWVVDETYYCESCRDEHENGHRECAICGEEIEPGMIMKPGETRTMQGRVNRTINGIPVSDEVWDRALAIVRQSERDADAQVTDLIADSLPMGYNLSGDLSDSE